MRTGVVKKVEFEVTTGPRGDQAVNLKPIA